MDDAFDPVPRDHALDEALVPDVPDEERHVLRQERGKSSGEVVDHDDAFAGFHQRKNHVTSDVAGAAGDKHGHDFPISLSRQSYRAAVKSRFRSRRTGTYA